MTTKMNAAGFPVEHTAIVPVTTSAWVKVWRPSYWQGVARWMLYRNMTDRLLQQWRDRLPTGGGAL